MGRPKQFDPETAVDQAMETFWRKGYAATTPQDLVDELGIGKGSLYNAFGSKRALFERALRRYATTQAVSLTEIIGQPGPVKERIRVALEALVELDVEDLERKGCFAVNTASELASSDPDAAAEVRRMFARTEDAFRAAIEEGQRAGEIAPDRDARALGALLLSTVVGMRVLAKTAEGADQLRRVVDGVLATF
ncbi:TetR/AcrR family transcriptional regulator [Streptomyces sp. CBMA152]|uniref:TetR/AcrR family transcriptional regulator n=1 Tax=Streptomyces sp. CBMA152 TaxID=1896312 RepID=UPI001660675A|nr:TetR/AcrR family transcriptional regulator [Streptomyces sp. CBMA152]MBD0747463.1 TetR family transcriptional regulator [Streptomyces sp. CBMA152]